MKKVKRSGVKGSMTSRFFANFYLLSSFHPSSLIPYPLFKPPPAHSLEQEGRVEKARLDHFTGIIDDDFQTSAGGIPGYRARIRPIVSRITIHWPSFYNVVTGKTLA